MNDPREPDSSSGSTQQAEPKLLTAPAGETKLLPAPAGQSPENHPPRRRRFFWLAAAALLVIAFFAVRYFHDKGAAAPKSAAEPPAAAITVGQSKTGDMNVYIQALGTVTPLNTVTIYSQVTGRVTAVNYREGQMVHEGDPLIEIDPRPYQATLTQAEGNLDHDRGLLAEARIDLKRYQDAYSKNAIAKQQLDDQEQVVVQYEGTVKADEGTVAYDQTQLSYCHIAAPVSGRVGLRLVDPGNTIFSGSNSTLVVITQLQPITVVFNVSEDDLGQVQAQLRGGQKLPVAAYDRSNEKQIASGTLTSLDNAVDTTTGTVRFRAEFANQNLSLFPNQFVNARLLVKTFRKVTLIPSPAVQHNGTQDFVYIVKPDNTVAVQTVTTLTSNDQETAVTGVNAGVNLATSGFDRLENGVKVAARGQTPGQKNTQGSGAGSAGSAAP